MIIRFNKNAFCVAIFLFYNFFAVGCASFYGNELSKASYDQVCVPSSRMTIDYDVSWVTNGIKHPAADKLVYRAVKDVFEKSGFFADFRRDGAFSTYHLSITMEHNTNVGAAMSLAMLCYLTLYIIPSYIKDEYHLTVEAKKGAEVLKTYAYKDHISSWKQLFLIFAMPFADPKEKVFKNVLDNMVLNFLVDLSKDGIVE